MTQAIIFTSPFYQSRSRPPTNLRPARKQEDRHWPTAIILAAFPRRGKDAGGPRGAEARAGPGRAFGVT